MVSRPFAVPSSQLHIMIASCYVKVVQGSVQRCVHEETMNQRERRQLYLASQRLRFSVTFFAGQRLRLRCRSQFIALALCVLCTGTWFDWRRDFKWLAPNAQSLLLRAYKSTESLEYILIYYAHSVCHFWYRWDRHLRRISWPAWVYSYGFGVIEV
jgi:hypothetical protein